VHEGVEAVHGLTCSVSRARELDFFESQTECPKSGDIGREGFFEKGADPRDALRDADHGRHGSEGSKEIHGWSILTRPLREVDCTRDETLS